jgi:hypothetical protein
MEFEANLDLEYIDTAWRSGTGTKLVKSHDWAYNLDKVRTLDPTAWIILIHRPDTTSFNWWKSAGGFDITYPSYTAYQNDLIMQREISWQNQAILKFAADRSLVWSKFTSEWITEHFDQQVSVVSAADDIMVTILK